MLLGSKSYEKVQLSIMKFKRIDSQNQRDGHLLFPMVILIISTEQLSSASLALNKVSEGLQSTLLQFKLEKE